MKKSIIILLVLFAFGSELIGQTNVSGLISSSTTWVVNGSPYIVVGNIAVEQGVSLAIEPGVRIEFDGAYYLYIDGTLNAQGNTEDSILFTSSDLMPQEGDWVGIKFKSTSTNNILDYCQIKFAQNAITIDGSSPTISHSSIINNTNGIYIHWNAGYPIISDNVISDCSYAGVYGGSYDGTDIIGNRISNCGFAIYTEAWEYRINYNEISFNNEGVYFDLGGGGMITEMKGNYVHHNSGYGMRFFGYSIYIGSPLRYNTIVYNGTGIYCKDFKGVVKYNEITNNETGILNANGSSSSGLTFLNNCIYDNELNFKQLRADNIDASNNWWGSTDSLTIVSLIYDYYDDFDLGKVFVFPILDSPDCSTSTEIPEPMVNSDDSRFIIFPNPSDGIFSIKSERDISSIVAFNLHGERIHLMDYPGFQTSYLIDISDYPKGIYFLRINQGDNSYTRKILVQ